MQCQLFLIKVILKVQDKMFLVAIYAFVRLIIHSKGLQTITKIITRYLGQIHNAVDDKYIELQAIKHIVHTLDYSG